MNFWAAARLGCCSCGNGAGKRFSPGGRELSRLKHLSSVGSHSRLKKMAMTSTFAHWRAGFGNGSAFIGRFISRQRIKRRQFLRVGHVKKAFEHFADDHDGFLPFNQRPVKIVLPEKINLAELITEKLNPVAAERIVIN